MRRYFVERRTSKYVKGYNFLSFVRKCKKQLLDTGLDSLKNACQKVVHKTDEMLWNKTADAVTKSNNDKIEKPEFVEEIIIPLEKKKDEILNKLRKVLYIKMEHFIKSKLLNDSTVSRFVTKWVQVNESIWMIYQVFNILLAKI